MKYSTPVVEYCIWHKTYFLRSSQNYKFVWNLSFAEVLLLKIQEHGRSGKNNKQNLIPFIRVAKSGFWSQTSFSMNPWLIS